MVNRFRLAPAPVVVVLLPVEGWAGSATGGGTEHSSAALFGVNGDKVDVAGEVTSSRGGVELLGAFGMEDGP